jgi:uncharacterized protein DUF4276
VRIGIIAEDESDVAVIREITQKLLNPKVVGFKRFVGGGCGKLRRKCGAWAKSLVQQGCSYIIVVHDLDIQDERTLRRELTGALAPARAKASVVLIPKHEIEAWLLYDGQAIAAVFRQSKLLRLPGNPESLGDPKNYLRDLVWKFYQKEYLNTVHNGMIAHEIRAVRLRGCGSFAPHFTFVELLKQAL